MSEKYQVVEVYVIRNYEQTSLNCVIIKTIFSPYSKQTKSWNEFGNHTLVPELVTDVYKQLPDCANAF